MTKQFAAACAVVALSSLTLAAQQSPQPASPQGPPAASQASAESALTVTMTGCLQSAAGSATASAGGAQFVLTNVQHSRKARESQPSSTTQAASEQGRAAGLSYALSPASAGVNLSQHVNHKVEITGTKIAGRGAARSESPAQTPAMTMPAISVTTVKMVSDSCS